MVLLVNREYILYIKEMYNDLFCRLLGMFIFLNFELDFGFFFKYCMCKILFVF